MSVKSGVYATVLHILAPCNITKEPVNSKYPMAQNAGVDRNVYNQVFLPMGWTYYPEILAKVISLLWTHTSITSLRGWKPNTLFLASKILQKGNYIIILIFFI